MNRRELLASLVACGATVSTIEQDSADPYVALIAMWVQHARSAARTLKHTTDPVGVASLTAKMMHNFNCASELSEVIGMPMDFSWVPFTDDGLSPEGLMKQDADSRSQFYSKMFSKGHMTITEMRSAEGLSPIA